MNIPKNPICLWYDKDAEPAARLHIEILTSAYLPIARDNAMTIPAAIAFCTLLLVLGALQLLLAAGAPIGHLAWGGEHRVLPARLRIGSVVTTGLYAVFAVVVLDRSGLVSVLPAQASQVGIWVITGVFLLGAIPNFISRSKPERYVMAPLSLLLSGLSMVILLAW